MEWKDMEDTNKGIFVLYAEMGVLLQIITYIRYFVRCVTF